MRVKLEDVCERGSSNLKQSDVVGKRGDYPVFGAAGQIGCVDFYQQERPYVAVVKDGAGIGRTTLLPAYSSVIGTMQYLLPKDNILPEYLCYVVRHMHLEKYFSGATIPHIYFKDYKSEMFNLGTIEKQEEIVGILGQVERVILNRKQQLQKLDELVKARFVEMFESMQWDTVRASSIMSNMRNGVSPSNRGHFPAKVLTLSAITQGVFDPSKWKNGMFDTNPPVEKRVCTTDFYMCRGNGNKNLVGTGVYSTKNRLDLVFPDTVIAASIDLQRVCMPYLAYVWKRQAVRKQIESGARTTNGTYKVNQGVISSVEIPLPPIELQAEFADFVKQIDKSKAAIQKALDEAQLLFDSLMQKYFL